MAVPAWLRHPCSYESIDPAPMARAKGPQRDPAAPDKIELVHRAPGAGVERVARIVAQRGVFTHPLLFGNGEMKDVARFHQRWTAEICGVPFGRQVIAE